MSCIKLSSGKTVCYGNDNPYKQGGSVLESNVGYHDPRFDEGGKTGEWMGNKLDQQGFITSATKGGNRISFTGNPRSDEWINKQIDTGKFGYNPKTGTVVKLDKPVQGLSKEDQIRATKEFARATMSGFPNKEEIAKLPKEQQNLINKVNEQKAKDLVVAQNNAALKNPVTYAPGAAFFGGLAAPYIGAGLEAATAALELPAVVGGTTIPLATGNNILGLAGGIMGANMLGSDLNTGYYSSDAPMMDKVARGFETGLNIFGTPGVSKRIGEALTLAGKSLKPNPYKHLEYSGDLYNLRNPVKTNVVRLTPEEATALQQKDRFLFKDKYDNFPSSDYIKSIKDKQKDAFDDVIDFTEKWGYQNLDEYKRLQQRNNQLTDELNTLSTRDPDQSKRIQEIHNEKNHIRERIASGEFVDPTFKQKIFDLNDEAGINYSKMDPFFNPNVRDKSKLVYVDPNDPSYYNLNQSDNDYITKNFPYINGVRSNTSTITLGSRPTVKGFYRKDIITPNPILLKEPSTWSNIFKRPDVKSEYFIDHGLDLIPPSNVGFTHAHEGGHDLQHLFDWIDNYQEYSPTYKYYVNRNDNPVSARFRKAMVEPTLPKDGRHTYDTWASGIGELHSDLQGERFNIVKDLMYYGDMSMDDAIKQLKTNPEPYLEDLIETSYNINKHFKPTTSKKEKLDLLLKLPVIGAGAVGVGAAAKSVGAQEPMQRNGGFIKAEEGKKNKKVNVKKPSASSNVFISPRNPIIPLTPVVSGGELADQLVSRNNNARMRSTTPISRPVVVTPPRPQPQPQPPVTNEEGLLDQLNNSANQFRQFLSDAYDRSLNATGEAISDFGDNITELLTPDYSSAPIYNEPEPQKNTPNTPPKPETPKKNTPLSDMDKLKLQFIKDNNLNISPDQIYLGSDDRGRQVFRLYNDKDPKIQSYRQQFEAADNDERGITERPGMQISKAISSNPGSAYCIATATGLICDQGFLNPELMKNKGRYWNPAVQSYAKNNKYNLTYNKKVNPLEFKGEPNSILQFTSEGHPFHATVLSDIYYPLDELNNPHYVTYGNPGSSSSGVVKKIYTFSEPSKAEVEGEHYLDYPGGVPALIKSNYKKQNGGKNAKTITLSTGKVVTLK